MTGLESAVIFFGAGICLAIMFFLWLGDKQSRKEEEAFKQKLNKTKEYHKRLWYGDESQDEVTRMINEVYEK